VIRVTLKEAEGHLGQLIEDAAAGQEVVITTVGGPKVRLVPLPQETREEETSTARTIGHRLDRFIGTWSAEQEAELLQAIEVFERVDESFWT
jgi:prevent-host-death family protein